jgi:hypothetical protein
VARKEPTVDDIVPQPEDAEHDVERTTEELAEVLATGNEV